MCLRLMISRLDIEIVEITHVIIFVVNSPWGIIHGGTGKNIIKRQRSATKNKSIADLLNTYHHYICLPSDYTLSIKSNKSRKYRWYHTATQFTSLFQQQLAEKNDNYFRQILPVCINKAIPTAKRVSLCPTFSDCQYGILLFWMSLRHYHG